MTPMRRRRTRVAPRSRRLLAIPAIVAVLLAGVITVTHDDRGATVSVLAGATAQPPTGPTGGGGSGAGGGNGGQFQPPDMPSPPSIGNTGSYPGPGQSGYGIDINSPAERAPGASQGGYNQASGYPQPQQPANGTQPPDYDHVPQQTAAPQHQQPGQAAQQQPAQQGPAQQPTQPLQQQGTQQLNQKQQQCQAAMGALGNVVSSAPVAIGGGGRGIHLKLDPPPPSPGMNCPGGCPTTAQPQPATGNQPVTLTPEQIQQMETDAYKQGQKDATKCDGATKFINIFGMVGSSVGVVASVVGAPFSGGQSLWGLIPSAAGIGATWDTLRKCSN